MMLEAAQYKDNCFVTLTHSEDTLPEDLSVHPRTLSLFVKNLRYRKKALRYFACGEYGDETMRPHYHLALFNFPTCLYGRTRHHVSICCSLCETVSAAWGQGRIELGTLTPNSMAYVAGYLNKKMTRDQDPRLEGRRPEFARMSLRPGIGAGLMHDLASTLMELGFDEKDVDVPAVLAHGKSTYPLGRYLRRKLRTYLGRDPNAPPEALEQHAKKLLPMRQAAFNSSTPFKTAILESTLGKRIQIEARYKRNSKRTL